MLYEPLQYSFGDLKKSTFNCLKSIASGMVLAGSIQISKIARFVKSNAKLSSTEKKISRFLDNFNLNEETVAQYLAKLLVLSRNHKQTVIIDRTNWKYGKHHRNLLVLGVLHKRQFIPLFSHNLGLKRKRGNSNHEDRIKIMDAFIKVFPNQKIKCIIADREFIGEIWLKYLIKMNIPFVVRLKEDWAVINDKDNQRTIPIRDYILPLMKDRRVIRIKVFLGSTAQEEVWITAFWICTRNMKTGKQEKELCILQHSECIKTPQSEYKKRWKIEACFKSMKSGGFNMESSQIVNEHRFDNLIRVVLICVGWMIHEGKKVKAVIKSNGFRLLSIFRNGLDLMIRKLTNMEKPPLIRLRKDLKSTKTLRLCKNVQ